MKLDLSKIQLSVHDVKKNIRLPRVLNPNLAELIGIHIGDGYLGYRENKKEFLIQCMGNPKTEKEHYDKFMNSSWKEIFNIDLNLKNFNSGCYGFMVYSKAIGTFFNHVLEMPIGKKSHTIKIPNIIKNTCKESISDEMVACIRGIIDTDFYLNKDNYSFELGAYFASRNLVLDLNYYLKKLGMLPIIYLDQKYYNSSSNKMLVRHKIRIRKKKDLEFWANFIGSHNPKFYKRNNFPVRHAPVV